MTKSAAQRAAALSHLMGTQLRLDLLREDRQRRQMERFILKRVWSKDDAEGLAWQRRLRKEAK